MKFSRKTAQRCAGSINLKTAEEAKRTSLSPEARKALEEKENAVRAELNALRKANGRKEV